MTSLLVMNGPNLNLLGTRQPEVYGSTTLNDIEKLCHGAAKDLGVDVTFMQSNHEGVLIDTLHAARGVHDGIVINGGAYTHTSIAIMDAILSCEIPTLELHLSHVHARESFRHKSCFAPAVIGLVSGLGANGYPIALRAMQDYLAARK